MIDRVGYEKIADVLQHPQHRLYDEGQGGGLWVGKRYGRSDRRMPDPLKGLSHAATANQVARFYYLMANGRLVNPERSEQMMRIMEGPELHHKFVNTLDRVAPKASIFRKSGSWSTFHSDSALVQDDEWRHYILVALIDDPQGENICRQLVTVAEEAMQSIRPTTTSAR
jgi:beta-lactamase class A